MPYLQKGESTVPPFTSRSVLKPIIRKEHSEYFCIIGEFRPLAMNALRPGVLIHIKDKLN